MDGPLSNLHKKEQGGLLIIDWGPEVEKTYMFLIGIYLSVFHFFYCVKEISTYMSE